MIEESTYVPFQDGIIFSTQGYYKIQHCPYCGKPAEHANCHSHRQDCPLYCDNINPVELSLGNESIILMVLLVIYSIVKFIKTIK